MNTATDKKSLLALQRGERLSSAELMLLTRKGLIQVDDARNMDSLRGIHEFTFIAFTARGKKVLEG
jgi:hypothetical protein